MELKDEREAEVTREKLRSLEARYQAVSQGPGDDAHIQERTSRSLKRMINQMKEESAPRIAAVAARRPVGRRGGADLNPGRTSRRPRWTAAPASIWARWTPAPTETDPHARSGPRRRRTDGPSG